MKQNIPFFLPDISQVEIDNVVEVLKSDWITTGSKTKEFERKISDYCGTNKTICLNSATAALEMCLRMLGVGPGDEVITSAYTFTASASVIDHVGAKIVLVDTEKDSYYMSVTELEKAITPKTKAVIPVDIAGVMCDYDWIFEVIENKKKLFEANNNVQAKFGRIVVLADAAHSFGATYKDQMSGSVADFTAFSFHAVKNLTTAEGGALIWKSIDEDFDQYIYGIINTLSLHGQTKDAFSKNQLGAWEYDIVAPAYKCNMTDIQAAIGLGQLANYAEKLKKRRYIVNKYIEGFSDILMIDPLVHYNEKGHSSGHLFLMRLKDQDEVGRNNFIHKLAECGITANVHYKPLPLLTAYKNIGFKMESYPNSYNQYKNEVTLPLYTRLSKEDVNYIIKMCKEACDFI
ncbi:MAG: DegT/DnrJ/EryC1/StrS family aminotransferase [Lactobacillales bacterium]|jgi:dTDP-4-amino-4,6-dideoxygalactose transaminase|nr:DegT/DnrJ/EryC1/StrS family aminotransferase [Lactobacillales bacterium]